MKFDFDRIAKLLHIEEKTREQPSFKAIREAVVKELNEIANPPAPPEAPKKAPKEEDEPQVGRKI